MNDDDNSRLLYQLREWVLGNSIHDYEEDRCVPDFSCCTGSIAPLEVRLRFAKAFIEDDQPTLHSILAMFLESCVQEAAKERGLEVHFAGCGGRTKH